MIRLFGMMLRIIFQVIITVTMSLMILQAIGILVCFSTTTHLALVGAFRWIYIKVSFSYIIKENLYLCSPSAHASAASNAWLTRISQSKLLLLLGSSQRGCCCGDMGEVGVRSSSSLTLLLLLLLLSMLLLLLLLYSLTRSNSSCCDTGGGGNAAAAKKVLIGSIVVVKSLLLHSISNARLSNMVPPWFDVVVDGAVAASMAVLGVVVVVSSNSLVQHAWCSS